jgi:pyrroloquinoline quinone biosynthesis protein B
MNQQVNKSDYGRMMTRLISNSVGLFVMLFFVLLSTTEPAFAQSNSVKPSGPQPRVQLIILGVAQDAGYPQAGCYKPHCMPAWRDPSKQRLATSLAVIEHQNKVKYLFEATPDIKTQLFRLHEVAPDEQYSLAGVFLTHAHMGHYTGLMHFGREAMGSQNLPVYAMPKMSSFLTNNGPWQQLVKLGNIKLKPLTDGQPTKLSAQLTVVPVKVPHRDEYSETVGYKIIGPNKTALFIPDIDKWQKWKLNIAEQIKQVDFALLDATFFANGELPNRDMSEVPHPFVEESMQLLNTLSDEQKAKVIFIHFNHSNPLLIENSHAQQQVRKNGFSFANEGMMLDL